MGFINVFVSLSHTHTHAHTHTHCYRYIYPSFGYPPPPPHPYAPPPHYRYPPPPLLPDGPSSFFTPNPYPLGAGYGYNPRGPRPIPYWLRPSCHCQVWMHTRGDLLSLVLGHARPHPMTNIPSAYMHAISHNHIIICRIHVSDVLITKNRFEYHVVHLHTCNSVTCI